MTDIGWNALFTVPAVKRASGPKNPDAAAYLQNPDHYRQITGNAATRYFGTPRVTPMVAPPAHRGQVPPVERIFQPFTPPLDVEADRTDPAPTPNSEQTAPGISVSALVDPNAKATGDISAMPQTPAHGLEPPDASYTLSDDYLTQHPFRGATAHYTSQVLPTGSSVRTSDIHFDQVPQAPESAREPLPPTIGWDALFTRNDPEWVAAQQRAREKIAREQGDRIQERGRPIFPIIGPFAR